MLRRIELARLFARASGELADQVFVGIAEDVAVGAELGNALGDFFDDGAKFIIAHFGRVASFSECRLISENKP